MNFNVIDFIGKKKDGLTHTAQEIRSFVELTYTKKIPAYQVSAWLMAVTINGMNDEETYHLTIAMRDSGSVYDYPRFQDRLKVDKHSTGGVGDSVSIILLPLLVAGGLSIPKLSGKGLGFTGGTIDKLASAHVDCELTYEESLKVFEKTGLVVLQQTDDVAPADGVFYALRDVTNTVMSIPLIASSIMSKKLALKKDFLFLDVKYGNGAFCTTLDMAQQLSNAMLKIAEHSKVKTYIFITSMQQPLSSSIGNVLEIVEAINFLDGKCNNARLVEMILECAGSIFHKTQIAASQEEGIKKTKELIETKSGLKVLKEWFVAQKGDLALVESKTFFNPKYKVEIKAPKSGYINFKNTSDFGVVANVLGAGRMTKEDVIDYQAGMNFHCEINDLVKEGDHLYTLYSSKEIPEQAIKNMLKNTEFNAKQTHLDDLIIHFNS